MKIKNNLLFIVLLLSAFKTQAQEKKFLPNADDNTLLWQISGNGLTSPSYLFGTFHLICKEDIPFGKQLTPILASTDELYLEVDLSDPGIFLEMQKFMSMQGDSSLAEILNTIDYKKVEKFFKDSLHTDLSYFKNTKPFFLMAFMYPKLLACTAQGSVEQELIKLAKKNNKPIRGLETMAFQASVFDSIPYKSQAIDLIKAIDSLIPYKAYFAQMVNAYKNQQLQEIQNLINNKDFGSEENMDILLDKRNKNWVKQLPNIMKNKSVFVAVGTGHLVGESGLISLLKKEGYTLTPMQNN